MARLILSLDGQTLAEYNMTKERYTVGRLPDNDIRIDNAAVSGHHSLIINILNDSFLEDLNSTNGTYVNGKLIKKHALQQGDVVTVGHHQLRYVDDQTQDETEDEFEKTMVIEPSGKAEQRVREVAERATAAAVSGEGRMTADDDRPLPDKPAAAPPPAAQRAAAAATATVVDGTQTASRVEHTATATQDIDPAKIPKLPLARLQVLSGTFAGRELELAKALTTLGRPGIQVAAISRRAEGYFIVTVEAKSEDDYPRVNGMSIGDQARKLRDNDVVQLAGVKMGFFLS
ncbi:MAG TPA: FHA domain-containing protein [Gammaproteobacteria bacterium]|nr:FHA domain-containing protein [Gammaproteobacteria bacterium]